jgi:hypothetical protein
MSTQERRKPGSDELKKASEHLLYEVRMLERATREIADAQPCEAKNAWIESFLVHARLLAHFLGWNRRSPPKTDDVIVEDYQVTSWTSSSEPPAIATMREPINKRIVHLSYGRTHSPADGFAWDFTGIANALLGRIAEFVRCVDGPKLCENWDHWCKDHGMNRHGASGPFISHIRSFPGTATAIQHTVRLDEPRRG